MTNVDTFVGNITTRYVQIKLADSVAAGIRGAGAGVSRTLSELGRVLDQGLAPEETRKAHQTIGARAQRSVLASYDQVVGRRRGAAGRTGYRQDANSANNVRHAGGALRRALKSERFFAATPRSLRFIDTDLLDEEAAHWARLNAGALGRGTGSRRRFEVRFSNIVVAAIGVDMTPSPGFSVPKGYWWDPEGGQPVAPGEGSGHEHEFYPLGEGPRSGATTRTFGRDADGRRRGVALQKAQRTRGIEARNFLDAGVATIARQLGPTYLRMYDDLFKKGIATARPGRIRVDVSSRTVQQSL